MSRNVQSSSSSSQTITAEQLLNLEAPLRLRLINRAQNLIQGGHGPNVEQMIQTIFKAAEKDDKAAEKGDKTAEKGDKAAEKGDKAAKKGDKAAEKPTTSGANQPTAVERVKKICENFKQTVSQYEADILKDFDSLSDEQQEAVVKYYEEATVLFCELFDWLDKVVEFTVQKLMAGFTLDRDAMNKVFGEVKKQMADLFKQPIV